jgi:hypothetical protein
VGEKIEVGIGMVEVECTDEEDAENEIIKKFNVVFQCDESPKIIVHVTKEDYDNVSLDMDLMTGDWSIDDVEYSDDDGNEDTTEGSYNGEMCVHAEKPWLDDFLGNEKKSVRKDLLTNREAVLEAVKQNGKALKDASDELKADKKVVLEAVKQNSWALEFASDVYGLLSFCKHISHLDIRYDWHTYIRFI